MAAVGQVKVQQLVPNEVSGQHLNMSDQIVPSMDFFLLP